MVAGDSKRIIVIKNISSNLIEEAILILKSGPDEKAGNNTRKQAQNKTDTRNDFLLKEAEYIINEYIREHGLIKKQNIHLPPGEPHRFKLSFNAVVNIVLAAAVLLLLAVIVRMF